MSLFDRFVMAGHGRADELAKDGAMLDGGELAQIRASAVQQKREWVHATWRSIVGCRCVVEEWHDPK